MSSGRTADVALRNAEMKAMRAGSHLLSGRRASVEFLCQWYGLSRKTVSEILNDPQSHEVTERRARPTVSLRGAPEDGLSHGSESGYRRCRLRDEGACIPCLNAHAKAQREYQASR